MALLPIIIKNTIIKEYIKIFHEEKKKQKLKVENKKTDEFYSNMTSFIVSIHLIISKTTTLRTFSRRGFEV